MLNLPPPTCLKFIPMPFKFQLSYYPIILLLSQQRKKFKSPLAFPNVLVHYPLPLKSTKFTSITINKPKTSQAY